MCHGILPLTAIGYSTFTFTFISAVHSVYLADHSLIELFAERQSPYRILCNYYAVTKKLQLLGLNRIIKWRPLAVIWNFVGSIRSEGKTVSGPWTVISSILHNNEHTQNVHTLLSTQSRIRIVDMLILNDLVA